MNLTIRPLTPADNGAAALVIRTVMPEFNCVGEGYSIQDPEMDDLYATYSLPRSGYFVTEMGGGGPDSYRECRGDWKAAK
ncbi:hypothetical protein [Neolewinella antarctica]|uniref:Acetyltransferase n=1 Tax=Neolewinella antarctica TaxID=442734 RepID=A0ABX0X9Q1_9BACT|nr:hypothetical protein [Neolewinella antarctica]NJC25995.1 hypothetical protein [Neolewinella antarctica]